MNLFYYLMNKNDKILVNNNHMLEYLLNKSGAQKEVSGTEINITDVTKEKIIKLTLDKESTQTGTPTPENPVEVKTVSGSIDVKITGKNLFDKDNPNIFNSYYSTNSNSLVANAAAKSIYIEIKPNTTYTISKHEGYTFRIATTILIPDNNVPVLSTIVDHTSTNITITTENTAKYLWINYYNQSNGDDYGDVNMRNTIQIEEEQIVTISLNNNEIAGIGDYKDELIIDKNGHCWLNKKTGKVVLDGSETVAVNNTGTPNWYYVVVKSMDNYIAGIGMSTHYPLVSISNSNTSQGFNLIGSPKSIRIRYGTEDSPENFKNWLSNNNVEIYDVLATENLIDLNYDVDIRLFNGVNNITNSDDMNMTLIYK